MMIFNVLLNCYLLSINFIFVANSDTFTLAEVRYIIVSHGKIFIKCLKNILTDFTKLSPKHPKNAQIRGEMAQKSPFWGKNIVSHETSREFFVIFDVSRETMNAYICGFIVESVSTISHFSCGIRVKMWIYKQTHRKIAVRFVIFAEFYSPCFRNGRCIAQLNQSQL